MRDLFSFPNPVDETSARLVAGAVAVLAVLVIAFQQGRLLPGLAYRYAAGRHTAALVLAGLCVGCKLFYLGMGLGIVRPHVCESCSRYVRA